MKKLLIGSLLTMMASTASANWEMGVSYAHMSDEVLASDISLGAVVGHVGYAYEASETFTFVPRLRLGFGVKEDEFRGFIPGSSSVDIKLSRFAALDLKLQFEATDSVYVYAMPSYANAKLSASSRGSSASEDDWEFGGGLGFGYRFSETTAIEASYESFDGTDVISIGINARY